MTYREQLRLQMIIKAHLNTHDKPGRAIERVTIRSLAKDIGAMYKQENKAFNLEEFKRELGL